MSETSFDRHQASDDLTRPKKDDYAHTGYRPRYGLEYSSAARALPNAMLYTPEMANSTQNANILAPLLESLKNIPRRGGQAQSRLYLEIKHFLADHNLN